HMVLDIAEAAGVGVEERGFTVNEALTADELFLSSATNFVLPVIKFDGQAIANGTPGVLTLKLRELYIKRAMELTT
ncbi:MAG: D-amino acid aminotransferase, partial [Gemmatimonadaceae bacterium]